MWAHARQNAAAGREHVRHHPIRVLDEPSPREPEDEPAGRLEPVRADRILVELELVTAPVELDGDLEVRIREVDPVSMPGEVHLVLVHGLGKTGVIEEPLDEASELVVRNRASPASFEYAAEPGDARCDRGERGG